MNSTVCTVVAWLVTSSRCWERCSSKVAEAQRGCHLRVIKDTCIPVGCTISSQEDGRVECLMLGRVIDAMVFFVDKVGI